MARCCRVATATLALLVALALVGGAAAASKAAAAQPSVGTIAVANSTEADAADQMLKAILSVASGIITGEDDGLVMADAVAPGLSTASLANITGKVLGAALVSPQRDACTERRAAVSPVCTCAQTLAGARLAVWHELVLLLPLAQRGV